MTVSSRLRLASPAWCAVRASSAYSSWATPLDIVDFGLGVEADRQAAELFCIIRNSEGVRLFIT